ncbi:MAG: TFIIB-type zinc ribbon-containing protein [Desulfurococcales archaeon]|jgi:transcription initiation factor TFIIIB Brf1 subunit/transcription initiation factor TFIIB|nr:TFIIB-type zinc ribbon-containing protein [Desulfurococcales archaeon]
MYQCPKCGSKEIIWDPERGEVVCSSCGLVIDEIYYYPKTFVELKGDAHEIKNRRSVKEKNSREKPGEILSIYGKLFGWWSLRRDIDIDKDRLLQFSRGGYNGRIFVHKKDRELEKMFEISPSLKKIYDYTSIFPKLSSRTFRARLLISYILLRDLYGSHVSTSLMSKAFSVSRNHLIRIRRELQKYPELIKFVSELDVSYKELNDLDEYVIKLAKVSEEV